MSVSAQKEVWSIVKLTLALGLTLSSKIATNSAFLATAGCGTSYSSSIDLRYQLKLEIKRLVLYRKHTSIEESETISVRSDTFVSCLKLKTHRERVGVKIGVKVL